VPRRLPTTPVLRLARGLFFTSLALLAFGCTQSAAPAEDTPSSNEPILNFKTAYTENVLDTLDESELPSREQVAGILESTGRPNYEFFGKRVLVDGDMLMHRGDFLENQPAGSPALAKTAQQFYGRVVDRSRVYTVWINPRLGSTWAGAVQTAMITWGGIAKIKYLLVPLPFMAHVQVDWAWVDPVAVVISEFPTVVNGRVAPGRRVGISYTRGSQGSNMAFLLMFHEFGHLIGFAHTNPSDGAHINGSPWWDPNSIMNAEINQTVYVNSGRVTRQNWITPADYAAFRRMYP
jgi:hypothetical protein